MIDVELDRNDHSSIFRNCIWEGTEPLDALMSELTPQPNSTGGERKKKPRDSYNPILAFSIKETEYITKLNYLVHIYSNYLNV
jgi:hypothetical protein